MKYVVNLITEKKYKNNILLLGTCQIITAVLYAVTHPAPKRPGVRV